ncbi:hypothetical protein LTR27_006162 [Elasticomyces elasticus]|nr:hypothetical protein LTR27_006162 [Elasticomyces elasticus]
MASTPKFSFQDLTKAEINALVREFLVRQSKPPSASERLLRTPHISRKPIIERTGRRHLLIDAIFRQFDEHERTKDIYGCLGYDKETDAKPPTCTGDCERCQQQYRPLRWQAVKVFKYESTYSDKEAQLLLDNLIGQTRSDLDHLASQIHLYGDRLMKRWQKRNPAARRKMLQQAMPDMATKPWFQAINDARLLSLLPYDRGSLLRERPAFMSAQVQTAYLLPFLDLTTLSEQPEKLLMLIHVRTQHSVVDWILRDKKAHDVAFEQGMLCAEYNPSCVVMRAEGFGQLVQWQEVDSHAGHHIGFPRALLAFRAQSRLASFLRTMADTLLAVDTGDGPKGDSSFIERVAEASALSVVAEQMHYQRFFTAPQLPGYCGMSKVLELLGARYEADRDELLLLQTEPLYLREKLARAQYTWYYLRLSHADQMAHLAEQILGVITKADNSRFVYGLLYELVVDQWDETISEGSRTFAKEPAIQLAYDLLFDHNQTQIEDLYDLATRSSTFQHQDNKWTMKPEYHLRNDPLWWNVGVLFNASFSSQSPAFHVSYMHDVINKASSKDRQAIDQRFMDHLSDLAMVTEAMTILEFDHMCTRTPFNHDPSTSPFSGEVHDSIDILRLVVKRQSWDPIDPVIISWAKLERTEQLYDSMHTFWSAVDDERLDHLQEVLWLDETRDEDPRWVNCSLSRDNGAEYTITRDAELNSIRTEMMKQGELAHAPHGKDQSLITSSSGQHRMRNDNNQTVVVGVPVQLEWKHSQEEDSKAQSTTVTKEKPKTRRDANVTDTENPVDALIPEHQSSPHTITVASGNLRLLQRMCSPWLTSRETSLVKFEAFVALLVDLGCTVEQHSGSAVTFRRENRSVVVHRPHPDSNITPIMLKAIGKRVTKYFGWDDAIFMARAK